MDTVPIKNDLHKFKTNFTIYPNPSTGAILANYNLKEGGPVHIKLVDINGKVMANLLDQVQSKGKYELNFLVPTSLKAGTYYLVLQTEKEQQVRKLVLLK